MTDREVRHLAMCVIPPGDDRPQPEVVRDVLEALKGHEVGPEGMFHYLIVTAANIAYADDADPDLVIKYAVSMITEVYVQMRAAGVEPGYIPPEKQEELRKRNAEVTAKWRN